MLQLGIGSILRTRARHKKTNTWHVVYGEVLEDSDEKLVIICAKKQEGDTVIPVMRQTFLLSEWDSFDNSFLGEGITSIQPKKRKK